MAETFVHADGSKEQQYEQLLPQLRALLENERDGTANMANTAAVLKAQFDWLWVGFYVVKQNELVLAPFQGPLACTRIAKGRGVCGQAWLQQHTLLVPDVALFAGHIACSSLSQSEIVVPMMQEGVCVGVLDVDSASLNAFDAVDQRYLEQVVAILMACSDFQ